MLRYLSPTFGPDPIKAYPNPVANHLTIESTDQQIIHKLIILNINGQIVQELNTDTSIISIDFSTLPDGLYIVEAHTQEHIYRTRITK